MMSSYYTEFLEYHRGRYHNFLKAGTRPVHARSFTWPPTISNFLGVNFNKEPFINKKQGSLSYLLFLSIMINLELIDLYLKGTFCGCAFVQNKEVSNYIQIFSQVLLYLTTATCIKSEFYSYSYFHVLKTISGRSYWPNSISYFGHFFEALLLS